MHNVYGPCSASCGCPHNMHIHAHCVHTVPAARISPTACYSCLSHHQLGTGMLRNSGNEIKTTMFRGIVFLPIKPCGNEGFLSKRDADEARKLASTPEKEALKKAEKEALQKMEGGSIERLTGRGSREGGSIKELAGRDH